MILQIFSIFMKELKDISRDRRTVMAAFAYALFGPFVLAFFITYMANNAQEKTYSVLVSGSAIAPDLITFLEKSQVLVEKAGESRITDILIEQKLPKNMDAAIKIPQAFGVDFQRGKAAELILYTDSSSAEGTKAATAIAKILSSYERHIVKVRLVARGIPSTVVNPVHVYNADLAKNGTRASSLTQMLILFFLLAPFFSSMSVAVDAMAGERERQSLLPLMTQPVPTIFIVAGKWLMAFSVGMIGTLLTILVGFIVLSQAPIAKLGIMIDLSVTTWITLAVILTPFVAFVSATQMFISITAKSFKEGQTYMTMLSMVPALAGYMMIFSGDKFGVVAHYLPIFVDMKSAQNLLFDGVLNPSMAISTAVISLIGASIFFVMTNRQLNREALTAAR